MSETRRDAAMQASPGVPHRVFQNVLGPERVKALLDYVAERQDSFKPAKIYDPATSVSGVDQGRRACWRLKEVGELALPIRDFVVEQSSRVACELGMLQSGFETDEIEICAYEDKGFFHRHIDTSTQGDRFRALTCVYYFSTTPAAFRGGGLKIYPLVRPGAPRPDPVVVEPVCDTLVMFPSFLPHEVLPVQKESGEWRLNRFNITTWARLPSNAGPA